MKKAKLLVLLIFVFGLLATVAQAAVDTTPQFVPGEIIVKFKPQVGLQAAKTTSASSINRLLEKHQAKELKKIFKDTKKSSKAQFPLRARRAPKNAKIPDLSNIYKIEVPVESDIQAIVQEFERDPSVEYAEPNYILKAFATVPNDPYYSSSGSWGQAYDDLWGLKKIEAEEAWGITTGSSDTVVAVIDSGLDYNHPDIAANVWANSGETPGNGIDDDGNGFIDDDKGWDFENDENDPMDDNGHGTHCSGTIAGVGDNGVGVVGVTWNSKIMALKGLDEDGYGSIDHLANAIFYAANNGADVLNMSWGAKTSSSTLANSIDYAYNAGCVLVAAAGNYNDDVGNYIPANYEKTIAVAATNRNDEKCDFSNWGGINVAAPGGDHIWAPYNYDYGYNVLSLKSTDYDPGLNNYVVDDNYLRVAGTSMAAPHVAGLAALIISAAPPGALDNETVGGIMMGTADDLGSPGWDQYFGSGRINAFRALTVISLGVFGKIESPLEGDYVEGALTITGTATGLPTSYQGYVLDYAAGEDPDPLDPSLWTEIASSSDPVEGEDGGGTLGTLDTTSLAGVYTLRLRVNNNTGGTFTDSVVINVANPVVSSDDGNWSEGSTWVDGVVPSAGVPVTIADGHRVTFDLNDAGTTCRDIEIESGGTLKFKDGTYTMQVVGDIDVYGKLQLAAGSTLKIENAENGEHGIIVYNGGKLEAKGSVPTVSTGLTNPLRIGDSLITVDDPAGFGVGDIITLGADPDTSGLNAEGFTITEIAGNTFTLNRAALNAQIATADVYKNATVTTPPGIMAGTPTLTVADLGGIQAGDSIAVAASSYNWPYKYTEIRVVESVDAAANSITVDSNFSHSHAAGAIVVKNNRDCLITSAVQDNEHNAYILVNSGGTLDSDYAEISFMGYPGNSSEYYGLMIVNSQSDAYPLHGSSVHNNWINLGIQQYNAGAALTLTANVFYANRSTNVSITGHKCKVISNLLYDADEYANVAALDVNGTKNFIADNYIFSNDWNCGLQLYSLNNFIINNFIFANRIGVSLPSSQGSLNLFSNNLINANGTGLDMQAATVANFFIGDDFEGNNKGICSRAPGGSDLMLLMADSHLENLEDIDITAGWDEEQPRFLFYLMNVLLDGEQEIAGNINRENSCLFSFNHDQVAGETKIWGDLHLGMNSTIGFNYTPPSHPSTYSPPILLRGANHNMTYPYTNDETTVTEVWFATYRSDAANWEVQGTVSGLQESQATSGNVYTSNNEEVTFTITESGPQEGDQFVFSTIAAAGDANTQKKLFFGPSAISELNNQSRIFMREGSSLEVIGTADYPTLIDCDGGGNFGILISGEIEAEYFDINRINSAGVQITDTAIITRFDNGSIRNVSGSGPHLSVSGVDHTFNYLDFDESGNYDVKAANDADLVFDRSQRGTFSDSIDDTSSIAWTGVPVLGYTEDNILGTPSLDQDTGIMTLPFKIKDVEDGSPCQFVAGSAYYSLNGGDWVAIADEDLDGIDADFESAVAFADAPAHEISWSAQEQLGSSLGGSAVRVKFRVYNGDLYSDYGACASFVIGFSPVLTVNPVQSPTAALSQTITGTTSADVEYVLVNGTSEGVTLSSDNTWSYTADLEIGSNQFLISALDELGNESDAVTVTIVVEAVEVSDGNGNKITLPIGAISDAVDFEINIVDAPKEPLKGTVLATGVVEITSSIDTFEEPASITLQLTGSVSNPRAYYYDTEDEAWSSDGLEVASQEGESVTFTTSHLSIFAVFDVLDTTSPEVQTVSVDGVSLRDGNLITTMPSFNISIEDDYSLDTDTVQIVLDNAQTITIADGISVSQVTTGSTLFSMSYTFSEDNKLTLGDHTFKFVVRDEVGNSSSYEITLNVVGDSLLDIYVYPNPYSLSDTLGIEFAGDMLNNGPGTIRVYDIVGQLVWSQAFTQVSGVTWDAKNNSGKSIASGIYIYLVTTSSGGKKIGKIAINN
ncbi:S8 family serine peptidase [Candidatus Margulisiibacteriota bacterium]